MSDWSRDFDKVAEDFGRALDSQFGTSPRAQIEFVDVPSSDLVKMGMIFGAPTTSAGVAVTESSAMRVAAVYACVRLIAGAIATLPLPVFRRMDAGRERANHDYWWLLNEQPCPRFSAATFWEFCVAQILLRGDGLAYIDRNPMGVARQFIPVRRDNVNIERDGSELVYRVHDAELFGSGKYFTVRHEDMLHFPGCGYDGVSSLSVIGSAAREAIGIAIQADRFSGRFYGSSAHVQYAVKAPGAMTPAQQDAFREAFVAAYGSGQGPTGRPLVLTEGLDITQLSMTAVDAQLLESRKWQVIDIARAFGVPPHMIGETSTSTSWGTGIEQMGIGFVRYTLMPHLTRISQELNRKLWPKRERYFVEHNVDALLEGDSKSQADYFARALGGPGAQGWMTVNEIRRLKNLPPIAGGDELAQAGTAPAKEPSHETPKPADAVDGAEPDVAA